ncbi:MAG: hypothetical protein MUE97_03955, partial [Phycisphaerales bacterium]|nr:hypothetical protein [Phycisphaerales bacterium]
MTDTFLRVRRVVLLICVVVAAMVGGVARPPSAAAESTLPQGQAEGARADTAPNAANRDVAELDDKNPVGVTAVAERAVTLPGDRFVIAVQFAFAEHFHIWPNTPTVPAGMEELVPIPTEISVGG